MSNITTKVAQIRDAVFGSDVRENIASGIEAINSEVESTTARQDIIDENETIRITAEDLRLENETARAAAEILRENTTEAIKLAYDNATKANLSVEVSNARGTYPTLQARQDAVATALADIVQQQLPLKANANEVRLKAEDIKLTDVDAEFISAITGGTTINLESIPQADSVTSDKLSPALRETLIIEKSWNKYNKALAQDGKIVFNNPTALTSYADGIFSGIVPVEVGKSYVISQKLRNIGAIYCYDETVTAPLYNTGGICAIGQLNEAIGTWGVATGKITRIANIIDGEYYVSKITILDPTIKFVAWHMHSSSYWVHTVEQFNTLVDSAQFEEGIIRTTYTDFGWENYKIKDDALPNEFKKLQNNDVVVIKSGTNISARVHFSDTQDLYHLWENPKTSINLGLNMLGIYTCDKDLTYDIAPIGEQFKSATDDITPLYLNGVTYVGGNHGWAELIKLTATNHGKTIADVGSVYNLVGGSKNFIIVDIVDANTLHIFSDYKGTQLAPTHYWSASSGTLANVSGGVNTNTFTFTTSVKEMLTPATNNKIVKYVLDGKEIIEDNVYYGDKFDIIESYNITDIPSIQQYIKDHAGTVINLADDTIAGWVTVTNIFSHCKNGSITVKTGFEFLKETTTDFYGVVQSMLIGSKAYVPNVGIVDGKDMSTVVTQGTNNLIFLNTTWLNADNPPYRYHQFNDDLSKGMALGYNTQFGVTKPNLRKLCADAGNYNGTTKKMYPKAKVGGSVVAGDYQETIAFRVPLRVIDVDATCLYWYWIGDDIYLAFDYHKNINKIIELPSYMAGMKIEQLDIHANTTVQSEFVSAKGIKVKVINNYGYGVLRLYN